MPLTGPLKNTVGHEDLKHENFSICLGEMPIEDSHLKAIYCQTHVHDCSMNHRKLLHFDIQLQPKFQR